MDKKTTGIVAYLTWIGLIIALVAGDKEGASFHLNQALVIFLFALVNVVLGFIPFIGWILAMVWGLFIFVCWLIGFIGALKDEEKEVPLIVGIRILKY